MPSMTTLTFSLFRSLFDYIPFCRKKNKESRLFLLQAKMRQRKEKISFLFTKTFCTNYCQKKKKRRRRNLKVINLLGFMFTGGESFTATGKQDLSNTMNFVKLISSKIFFSQQKIDRESQALEGVVGGKVRGIVSKRFWIKHLRLINFFLNLFYFIDMKKKIKTRRGPNLTSNTQACHFTITFFFDLLNHQNLQQYASTRLGNHLNRNC